MTSEDIIKTLKQLEYPYPFNEEQEKVNEALSLAIRAVKITDIPFIRNYIVLEGKKIYIDQGHIDALLEYERKQTMKKLVENFTKSFNVDLPKDFYRGDKE